MTKRAKKTGKRSVAGMTMGSKRRIYIAGPINGKPDHKAAFKAAAMELRSEGWVVYSPAETDFNGATLREIYSLNCDWLIRASDAIYMLKGWESSRGAKIEEAIARELGLRIFYED